MMGAMHTLLAATTAAPATMKAAESTLTAATMRALSASASARTWAMISGCGCGSSFSI